LAQSASDFLQGPSPIGGGPEAEGPGVVARTPRQLFWRRFKEDRLALFGGFLVVLMIGVALAAPIVENLTDHPYDEQYRDRINAFGTPLGPSSEFPFGNDDLGRDIMVRTMYGARVSLTIAIVATGVELVIGIFLGILAGFMRGWVDTIVSRFIDLILSIPFLLLGIALSVTEFLGGGEKLIIFIIAFFGWPYIARIVRGQTLSLREAQFVEAAYSVGAPTRWIMFREILPNLLAPILIYGTLIIPQNIVGEAALSFLGVGVQQPTAAWGQMLAAATPYVALGKAWWFMLYPGLALFITVLGFNLLGDGLRDALDPKTGR
jgi:ABC-type dipeptide/oligopeptide/nickel transport system permease subunit